MLKLFALGTGSIAAFVAACMVFVYVATSDADGGSASRLADSRVGGARQQQDAAQRPFTTTAGAGGLPGQFAGGTWPEGQQLPSYDIPELHPDDRAALDAEGQRKRDMMKRGRHGKPPRSAEDLE